MEGRKQQRSGSDRYSVSFSIAYARVCEWAQNPKEHERPRSDTLEKAKEHANRINDPYILSKIRECENYYVAIETTPTPKRPSSSTEADRISKEIAGQMRRITQPYAISYATKEEWADTELDQLLKELDIEGL